MEDWRERPKSLFAKAGEAAKDRAKRASQGAVVASKLAAQTAVEGVRRADDLVDQASFRIGESPSRVLASYPHIQLQLERRQFLGTEDERLLDTVWNVPWATAVKWGGSRRDSEGRRKVDHRRNRPPVPYWAWAPEALGRDQQGDGSRRWLWPSRRVRPLPSDAAESEHYDMAAVPAFSLHLLQDFMSPAGIPFVPGASSLVSVLRGHALNARLAQDLVCLNFAELMAIAFAVKVGLALIGSKQDTLGDEIEKWGSQAASALDDCNYAGAIQLYGKLLDVKPDDPTLHIGLAQAEMRRTEGRFQAHMSSIRALTLLAKEPERVVSYGEAKLSLQGLAALQALSTIDEMQGIKEANWKTHSTELTEKAIEGFLSTAEELEEAGKDKVPNKLVYPPFVSAAINRYLAAYCAAALPVLDHNWERAERQLDKSMERLDRVASDHEELAEDVRSVMDCWQRELKPSEPARELLAAV